MPHGALQGAFLELALDQIVLGAGVQRLVQFYPDAAPARLELGTAVRSGWWSPAPLRPS